MRDIQKLNIAPTVSLLGLLKNMRYTEWHALAEFVDNSIQSYLTNKKILKRINPEYKLKIKINLSGNEIEIRDNAAGINSERYESAFETGKAPPDKTGLSEFGVGMKIAACWFSDKWSVLTTAVGENFYRLVEFDIKKIQENNISFLDVTTGRNSSDQSYTIVRLKKLNHKPKGQSILRIREHLSSMYRHMISSGEIEILIDSKKLDYEIPEIRIAGYYNDWLEGVIRNPKKIKWFKKFNFDFKYKNIQGYVGIRKKGRVAQEGFSLFRRNRLIINSFKPVEIFGYGNDRRQQVIFGEVHMDEMNVAFSKNDFIWDDNEKSQFISLLKKNIEFIDSEQKKSIILQAKNWSENMERDDIRTKSKEALNQVANLIQRGLEQTSSEKMEIKSLTQKHILAKESDERQLKVNFEGKIWRITVNNEYDRNADYVYDLEIADKNNEEVKIFINLGHSFLARYFDNNIEGLSALLAYFAISEIQVWKFDGVKGASLLRSRFNALCKNLPPRT